MSNPSKKKGTAAETKVVRYLATFGIEAERRALAGSEDVGDIKMIWNKSEEFTLEVKAGKQTANPSRSQLEEWLRQAEVEGKNAGCRSALVIVRYRRAIEDADVYIPTAPCAKWVQYMHLDEFAEWSSNQC